VRNPLITAIRPITVTRPITAIRLIICHPEAQPRDLLFTYVNNTASRHSHKDVSQLDANPHETPAPKGRKKPAQPEKTTQAPQCLKHLAQLLTRGDSRPRLSSRAKLESLCVDRTLLPAAADRVPSYKLTESHLINCPPERSRGICCLPTSTKGRQGILTKT
jgi:hypothetical protein